MRYLFIASSVALTLSFVAPAFAWNQIGPCVPSETDDCKGGNWAGSMTQCADFDYLVCEQFESPRGVCYGIRNTRGCIAGSGANHFRRPVVDMTAVPLCPVWEAGRQWVARRCP